MRITVTQRKKVYNVNVSPIVTKVLVTKSNVGKRGKSAYEIAITNGFVGTEEQWLLSLQGQSADLSVLGNYERDWEQDFLIALNT